MHTEPERIVRGIRKMLLESVTLMVTVGGLLLVGYVEESLLATLSLAFLWGAIGTVLLALERNTGRLARPLLRYFWITYGLRIFVTAVLHIALRGTDYWPWWDFGSHGGDELLFWDKSEHLVMAWRHGTILQESPVTNAFAWLQLVAFNRFVGGELAGETVFNARLVLSMAGALIVPYVYGLGLRLFDERVGRLAAVLAFLLPDYWFYSSTLMRDVLVSCVVVIIYYQVVTMMYGGFSWWRLVLGASLNFWILPYLRADLMYLNVALVILFAMWGGFGGRADVMSRAVLTLLVGSMITGILFTMGSKAYSLSAGIVTSDIIEYKTTVLREGALEEATVDSLGAWLLRLPLFLRWPLVTIALILQPFPPWAALHGGPNLFPLKALMIGISGMVWFVLALFLPVGLLCCSRAKPGKTVWVWGTAVIMASLLGFISGGHPRWRLMYMPFLLIVIAQGIVQWRRHSSLVYVTVICMVAALSVYSVLKYVQ